MNKIINLAHSLSYIFTRTASNKGSNKNTGKKESDNSSPINREEEEELLVDIAYDPGTSDSELLKLARHRNVHVKNAAIYSLVNRWDSRQGPLFDYARDVIHGRINKFTDIFPKNKYKNLSDDFFSMGPAERVMDPYKTGERILQMWESALRKANQWSGSRVKSRKDRSNPDNYYEIRDIGSRIRFVPEPPKDSEWSGVPIGQYTSLQSNRGKNRRG